MNATLSIRPARRAPFHGVAQIVAFNWPKYALSIPVAASLATGPALIGAPAWAVVAARIFALVIAWWTLASLAASHWAYDRAGLYKLDWLTDLTGPARRWASIHAGLDELSPLIERRFGVPPLAVLDIYDQRLMPEPSIARARAANAPASQAADHRRLPLPDRSCDLVLLALAAHELRSHTERCALFAEVARAIAPGGRAVVVEHLRDGWNFAAFGPGFFHFLSRREWLSTFAAAGLAAQAQRSISPFIRVFALTGSKP